MNEVEKHPFEPFLPKNSKVLFLGSFPPQAKRWSMKFFYPNYNNDFWYLIGLLWFNDKKYFTIPQEKRFDYDKVINFCNKVGFSMFDTACEVIRLKDNASDKYLQVVTPTNIPLLLSKIPECYTIVTTGQKSTEIIGETFGCELPKMGEFVSVDVSIPNSEIDNSIRKIKLYRLPSTSRAYPISLEKKSEYYKKMFEDIGLLV